MSAAAIRRKWAGKEERRSTGYTYQFKLLAGQGEAGKSTEGQDEQQGGRLHPICLTPRPPTLMSLAIPIVD